MECGTDNIGKLFEASESVGEFLWKCRGILFFLMLFMAKVMLRKWEDAMSGVETYLTSLSSIQFHVTHMFAEDGVVENLVVVVDTSSLRVEDEGREEGE